MTAMRSLHRAASLLVVALLATGCQERGSSPAAGSARAPSSAAASSPPAPPQKPSAPVDALKRRTYTLAADGDWIHAGTTAGVVSWNVSNPASPRQAASVTLAGSVADVAVVDPASHLLAVSTGPTGIAVVDAAQVAEGKLTLRGEHPWTPQARGGCHAAWKVAPVAAERAFVACGGGGIGDLEIHDGGARVQRTADVGGYVRDLVVLDASRGVKAPAAGKRVAAAAGFAGLVILDLGGLNASRVVARVELPGEARALDVQEGMIYVAAGAAGLQIVDARDPTKPAVVGAFDPDVTDMARGVVVRDKRAYVCFGESGLVIVDVRDPAAPARAGGHDPERSLNRALLKGNLLVTANDDGGLLLLDVTNPGKLGVVHPVPKDPG